MGKEAVDANALTEAANEKGLVEKNLPLLSASQIVVSDNDLLHSSDTTNLREHNNQYTELLKAYVNNSITSLKDKQSKKNTKILKFY